MKKILYTMLIGATIILLPSCSALKRAIGNDDDNTASTTAQKGSGSKVLPTDRQSIEAQLESGIYTPQEFANGVVKGRWSIETVFGKEAIGEKVPRIEFSENKKEFYGNNGCNTMSGDYTYNTSNHTLTFSNVAVTMMLCHLEGITDIDINRALNDTRYYSLEETPDGYVLNLFNEDHEKVMTMSNQNFEFLNGSWKVVKINDTPIDNEKMLLVFDVPEKKVNGNTGCNALSGQLLTNEDTEAPNSISFEGIAVTMMACPEMENQSALLFALEDACRAKPLDSTHVEIFNSTGQPVLTLERIFLKK